MKKVKAIKNEDLPPINFKDFSKGLAELKNKLKNNLKTDLYS